MIREASAALLIVGSLLVMGSILAACDNGLDPTVESPSPDTSASKPTLAPPLASTATPPLFTPDTPVPTSAFAPPTMPRNRPTPTPRPSPSDPPTLTPVPARHAPPTPTPLPDGTPVMFSFHEGQLGRDLVANVTEAELDCIRSKRGDDAFEAFLNGPDQEILERRLLVWTQTFPKAAFPPRLR